jgi:glycosyltransferase involved in cell wall biosynthesis
MHCPTLSELPPPPSGKTGWPWTEESSQIIEAVSGHSNWPRVSVVTPSYNQAEFLEETIRSVLLQGYPDLEYIIIDGASTDGSVEIIKKYEPWLAYWESKPDGGQSDALNTGWLKHSTGQFFGWINSDDVYGPGLVTNAVAYLTAHPAVACVYNDCDLIDESSRPIGKYISRKFELTECLLEDFIPQQTAFITGEAVRAIGGVDASLHYSMDSDLFIRLARHYTLQQRPGTGASFRVNSKGKTVSQPGQFLQDRLRILDKFFDDRDVPADIVAQRTKFYTRAYVVGHLRIAMMAYAAGAFDMAAANLEGAIQIEPALLHGKPAPIMETIISYALVIEGRTPKLFMHNVFSHWPISVQKPQATSRSIFAHLQVASMFQSYRIGNVSRVRAYFWRAIVNDPFWLSNRGVVAIGLESILGSRLTNKLKRFRKNIRAPDKVSTHGLNKVH